MGHICKRYKLRNTIGDRDRKEEINAPTQRPKRNIDKVSSSKVDILLKATKAL
jgi:hypothetical protein